MKGLLLLQVVVIQVYFPALLYTPPLKIRLNPFKRKKQVRNNEKN